MLDSDCSPSSLILRYSGVYCNQIHGLHCPATRQWMVLLCVKCYKLQSIMSLVLWVSYQWPVCALWPQKGDQVLVMYNETILQSNSAIGVAGITLQLAVQSSWN